MAPSLEALISEKDYKSERKQVFLGSPVTLRYLSQFLNAFGREVPKYTLLSVSAFIL